MNIKDYISLVETHRHCEEGLAALKSCRSPLEVHRLSCTIDGRSFLMESIRDGWGPSVSDFCEALGISPYRFHKQYTFERGEGHREFVRMYPNSDYVPIKEVAEGGVAVSICLGKKYLIKIDNGCSAEVYAGRGTKLNFMGSGFAIVYDYGCEIGETDRCSIHRINRRRAENG